MNTSTMVPNVLFVFLVCFGVLVTLILMVHHVTAGHAIFDNLRRQVNDQANLVVTTRQGALRGKMEVSCEGKTYLAFKGIPYGKPPLGNLRFRAPEPAEAWSGVRDATRHGASCLQVITSKVVRSPLNKHGRDIFEFLESFLDIPPEKKIALKLMSAVPHVLSAVPSTPPGEDCLFLNVYVPTVTPPTSSLLPVLVFFHGGAFMWGDGTTTAYGPDYLIGRKIVVVTVNYRLGPFGFLSSNSSDAPGNAGLKDQVLALQWVRDNVQAFGGDPARVTIFGESAGGASVHYHVLSPLSAGLFSGAIMSSSSAVSVSYQPVLPVTDVMKRLVRWHGGSHTIAKGPEAMVKFLRSVPALSLTSSFLEIANEDDFRPFVPLLPTQGVVEPRDTGEPPLLTEDPKDALVAGRFNKVPIIVGSNLREGTVFFITSSMKDFPAIEDDKTRLIPSLLYSRLDDASRKKVGQLIWDTYLKGQHASKKTISSLVDAYGDVAIVHGMAVSTKWMSKHMPVYRYHFVLDAFNFVTSMLGIPKEAKGPGHADDLFYIFHAHALGDMQNTQDAKWRLGRDRFLTMIENFAYSGNPTPNVSETFPVLWPPATPQNDVYMELDEKVSVKSNLWPERMSLWTRLHGEILGHPVYNI